MTMDNTTKLFEVHMDWTSLTSVTGGAPSIPEKRKVVLKRATVRVHRNMSGKHMGQIIGLLEKAIDKGLKIEVMRIEENEKATDQNST